MLDPEFKRKLEAEAEAKRIEEIEAKKRAEAEKAERDAFSYKRARRCMKRWMDDQLRQIRGAWRRYHRCNTSSVLAQDPDLPPLPTKKPIPSGDLAISLGLQGMARR